MSDEKAARPGRTSLLLVAIVCIAPFVASFIAYFLWQPAGRVNYGELLTAAPLTWPALADLDGAPFDSLRLRGKWVYVTVDSGACDDYCRGKLWKMRQVRRTQGKYMERIERLWLVDDGRTPEAALLKEHEGMWVLRAAGSALLAQLPAAGVRQHHIYLVDPLGNLVLRYPRDADPSRMRKDLERLLKVSRIG
jgi:cytochrome oxidase Cu insertion factor (SCO1/SenC/PrrC family)